MLESLSTLIDADRLDGDTEWGDDQVPLRAVFILCTELPSQCSV